MLTVFVLQFVLLEGVTANCGNDVQSIEALIRLGFTHLAFYQGADMFIALQQGVSRCFSSAYKVQVSARGCTCPMSSRAMFCAVAMAPLLPFLIALSKASLNSASRCQGIPTTLRVKVCYCVSVAGITAPGHSLQRRSFGCKRRVS